jgi:hypothetical protein
MGRWKSSLDYRKFQFGNRSIREDARRGRCCPTKVAYLRAEIKQRL